MTPARCATVSWTVRLNDTAAGPHPRRRQRRSEDPRQGQGAGENGGPAGDVYVLVHVRPHPVFGRSGDNVTVTVPVTYPEAALGAEIQVPTLTGTPVRLKLAPGTKNGQVLRVRNRGAVKSGDTRGDMLVTVEVTVPGELPDAAKDALRAYQSVAPEADPRAVLFTQAARS